MLILSENKAKLFYACGRISFEGLGRKQLKLLHACIIYILIHAGSRYHLETVIELGKGNLKPK